jgi:hypothetical protein
VERRKSRVTVIVGIMQHHNVALIMTEVVDVPTLCVWDIVCQSEVTNMSTVCDFEVITENVKK